MQVMGILETRNLDFENVVLLSMNDDNFPGNHMAQASFVPYNLRAAYGLPTPEHHEGVYAYYFYRLVQRARRVWMLYCSHADDKSTGEPSRYIYQLDYESGFRVRKVEVGVDVNLAETGSDRGGQGRGGDAAARNASPTPEVEGHALADGVSSATWPAPCGSISTPWRVSRPTTRLPRRSTPRCSARSFTPRCRHSTPGSWARRIPARPCGR